GVDLALALEHPLATPAPAWRHPAPDHLPDETVCACVRRRVLVTPEVAVALAARHGVARPRERLGLAEARVRLRTPPGRLDRPAAVWRDDQVTAGLVQPL